MQSVFHESELRMSESDEAAAERELQREIERRSIRVVKIILPRANARDVLAAEMFIGALSQSEPLALEIAATAHEKMFVVRAESYVTERAITQLRHAYPQCDFEELGDTTDPADLHSEAWDFRELRLREAAYLPIRTHISREGRITNDDLERAADPMIGVLSAMDGLGEGEVCVAQYSIRAMTGDWSKYWRGSLGDISERTKATPTGLTSQVMLPLSIALLAMGALFLVLALVINAPALLWLLSIAWLAVGSGLIAARFRVPSPPDPLLVKQKINQAAFRVQGRIFAGARDAQTASERLERMMSALRAYNVAGGNGFEFVPLSHWASQRDFRFLNDEREPFVGFVRKAVNQLPILSVSEVAALWHLPHGEVGLQGVHYTSSRWLAPLPCQVADGVHIGTSRLQGKSVAVRLPREALAGNIGLVAKTQSGKSNLMAILAADIISSDPEAAVIVIDPHRSLAQQVARLIPPDREADAIYWSVADRERPFGLNLLDRIPKSSFATPLSASDLFADKRISDIIDSFREVWIDNWGPRMEDYLRGPLLTLARANEVLARNYAFEHWLTEARLVFAGNREQINSGRIDAQTLDMIAQVCRGYRPIPPPPRPAYCELHSQLATFVEDYEKRRAAWQAGVAGSAKPFIKSIRDLNQKVSGEIDSEPNEPGAALWARTYEDDPRPFQFTILDVNAMLMGSAIRATALSGLDDVTDRYIFDWWRDSYDAYLEMNARLLLDMITPVTKKLNRFAASEVARRIFGQPDSTVDLAEIIHEGKILMMDLASGVIGQETAALTGSIILNWLATILFAQQEVAKQNGKRRRVFIVVDEFQTLPGANYTMILSELAKYGAQLVLGTQSLAYLMEMSAKTRSSWLANTTALFVFRCGADDAKQLANELNVGDLDRLSVTPEDIVGLSDYSCFVRVQAPDRVGGQRAPHIFRVDTRRAGAGEEATFARIRERSRQVYGRDVREVDKWIHRASELQGKTSLVAESHNVYSRRVPTISSANAIEQPSEDRRQLAERIKAEQRADKRDDPPIDA